MQLYNKTISNRLKETAPLQLETGKVLKINKFLKIPSSAFIFEV